MIDFSVPFFQRYTPIAVMVWPVKLDLLVGKQKGPTSWLYLIESDSRIKAISLTSFFVSHRSCWRNLLTPIRCSELVRIPAKFEVGSGLTGHMYI